MNHIKSQAVFIVQFILFERVVGYLVVFYKFRLITNTGK